ncbi:MAG: leucine-rich repeat protein, partial [Butyricimonas sp.]|nr:leucine-rich repeat protein [Butyricimonas sp.]
MARIIGNPTVTPMAVPDWNQTNEMRADFIKNRPLEAIKTAESLRYYGDANIVPSDASLFLFALDDTTMTASVKAKSNSISGDIVIPYKYIDGNKTYTVASLADSAFNNRDAITSITIPKSVESIGKNAVSYCDTIASITIPKSVTNIGDYGIFSCPPLTDIYYEGSKEDWAKISFGNEAIPDGAKIHY